MKKIFCLMFILIMLSGCSKVKHIFSTDNSSVSTIESKNTSTETQEDGVMKLFGESINIKSPIDVTLKMNNLSAELTFINNSTKEIILDKNLLGGDKIGERVFHLNPWYTSPNLEFNSPYHYSEPDYIVMKPGDKIITNTDLRKFYDFKEKDYEILSISFLVRVNLLDDNYKICKRKDGDGVTKPVSFAIKTESVKLDFNKDILPNLPNNL